MKVILDQDVYNLGEEGDVCDVKRGYARNYLIPKKLALPYTKQTVAVFEAKKEKIEKRKEEKRQAAKSMKDKLEGLDLVVKMPAGDTGKLFGAVTSLTIADELAKAGITIERKRIELPVHNLKMVGNYTAKVKLYENEAAQLKIVIEQSEEEKKADSKKSAGKGKKKEAAAEAPAEEAAAEAPAEEAAAEAPAEEAAAEAPAEEAAVEAPAEEAAAEAPAEEAAVEAPAEEAKEETVDSEADTVDSEADTADSEADK